MPRFGTPIGGGRSGDAMPSEGDDGVSSRGGGKESAADVAGEDGGSGGGNENPGTAEDAEGRSGGDNDTTGFAAGEDPTGGRAGRLMVVAPGDGNGGGRRIGGNPGISSPESVMRNPLIGAVQDL
jgi:hypothetical protein